MANKRTRIPDPDTPGAFKEGCVDCNWTGKRISIEQVDDETYPNMVSWEVPCDCQDKEPVTLETYGQRFVKHFESCKDGCSGYGERGEIRERTYCAVGYGLHRHDEIFAQGQGIEIALWNRLKKDLTGMRKVMRAEETGETGISSTLLSVLNMMEELEADKKRGLLDA